MAKLSGTSLGTGWLRTGKLLLAGARVNGRADAAGPSDKLPGRSETNSDRTGGTGQSGERRTGTSRAHRLTTATLLALAILTAPLHGFCRAEETKVGPDADGDAARRGYRFLTEKAYVPPALNEKWFAEVWRAWPEPLRSEAERATPAERRRMAFARYGLTPRPGDDSGKPLQYVVDDRGNWSMNCFACHGGSVNGQVVPGLPNSQFALETLIDEIREAKLLQGEPPSRADLATLFLPMGTTRGTTNAIMFGVILMANRTPDLQVKPGLHVPKLLHHDMDAPPWWNVRKRSHLYLDGHAQKGHRGLMQFMLVKENGPEKFREWEADFRDVYAFIESVRPPRYPFAIDEARARRGERVFVDHCARCHGTYGEGGKYPEVNVPIEEIGTDRARYDSLTPEMRAMYGESWFADFGKQDTVENPAGYVAPPLDGIWASAPYLHNGSVPTLWHLLNSDERPVVWKRASTKYDAERMGLDCETWATLPEEATQSKAARREYFDTRGLGKSAGGHRYPDELTATERREVLEYLKKL